MTLSVIVAVSKNGVIGRNNDLPWHLPADLKRFKSLTMDHSILMGRKTWESIARPLPGRRMVVITRDRSYTVPNIDVVHSLSEAIEACAGEDEVFVIGGEAIFREALPLADRVYLTQVHARVDGDVRFPDEAFVGFEKKLEERYSGDEKNAYDYSFCVYEKTN